MKRVIRTAIGVTVLCLMAVLLSSCGSQLKGSYYGQVRELMGGWASLQMISDTKGTLTTVTYMNTHIVTKHEEPVTFNRKHTKMTYDDNHVSRQAQYDQAEKQFRIRMSSNTNGTLNLYMSSTPSGQAAQKKYNAFKDKYNK